MNNSPVSAADILLERYHSSLNASNASQATDNSIRVPARKDAAEGTPAVVNAVEELIVRAPLTVSEGAYAPQQGEMKEPVASSKAPGPATGVWHTTPPSRPQVSTHEADEMYDSLEFRIRSNDRDLQSILTRSTDRLGRLSLNNDLAEDPTSANKSMTPLSSSKPVPRTENTPPPSRSYATAEGGAGKPLQFFASTAQNSSDASPAPSAPKAVSEAAPSVEIVGDSAKREVPAATPNERQEDKASRSEDANAFPSELRASEGSSIRPDKFGTGSETPGGGGIITPQRSKGSYGSRHESRDDGRPSTVQQSAKASGGGRRGSVDRLRGSGVGTSLSTDSGGANIAGVIGTPPRLPGPLANSMIVEAATEAARWLAVDDRTWHQAKKFMDDCIADCPNARALQRRNLTADSWRDSKIRAIEASLAADPSLATCRHVNRSAFPMDGWTPLHAAAARGNLDFVKALLEIPSVSVWSVDLQGRTALALAAEGGHLDLCLLLKERMEAESADTIVGINAPVDLAGRTPLAWSVRSRARNKQVEGHLYAAGDASVCPATPAALRSGGGRTSGVGTGAGYAAVERQGGGLPCGFADVPGWRIEMEDAICSHNPLELESAEAKDGAPEPTSMFGIFDGHGGAFTSRFVADALGRCLRETEGWKSGDRQLQRLCPALLEAFVKCDELLAEQPRMTVTEVSGPQGGKRYEARDGSGSTAIVALITPMHAIIGNAGDSRAILVVVPKRRQRRPRGGMSSKSTRTRRGSSTSSSTKSGSSKSVGFNDHSDYRSRTGIRGADVQDMTESRGTEMNDQLEDPEAEEADEKDSRGDTSNTSPSLSPRSSSMAASILAALLAPASPEAMNDSVRLEDQLDDDKYGSEDRDHKGSSKHKEDKLHVDEVLSRSLRDEAEGTEEEKNKPVSQGEGNAQRGYTDEDEKIEVTALSRDHTAADEDERERVERAGGRTFEVHYTEEDGRESTVVRTAYDDKVEGQSVMPTRGFGDLYYKQKKDEDGKLLAPAMQVVTACPEIMIHERGSSGGNELLLLACDGVWDVLDNQDAGEFMAKQLDGPLEDVTGEDLARACDALVQECLRRGSTDNITAMAISLGSGPPPLPSAVGGRALFNDE